MDDSLELEGYAFEKEEGSELSVEQENPDEPEKLKERWASWVNIVNR